MNTKQWNWVTKDGIEMFSMGWIPDGKTKAVIVLIHGLGEHVKRYQHVAERFNKSGYAVFGLDMRGHGESGGPRGHAKNLKVLFDDLDQFFSQLEQQNPGVPKYIYGHSLGGLQSLAYVPERKPKVAGVVVTGPSLKSAIEEQKVKVLLAKMMGKLCPSFTLLSGLDPSTLSRDQQVVDDYINDPLVHNKISSGLGLASLVAIALAKQSAPQFPVPVLVMHGGADKLGYPEGSINWAARAPKEKCILKVWDGFFHEIHNEPEKDQVITYALDWIAHH